MGTARPFRRGVATSRRTWARARRRRPWRSRAPRDRPRAGARAGRPMSASAAMRRSCAAAGARSSSARPAGVSATSTRRASSSARVARHEPAPRELAHDDRDGALVRQRARRELVDRQGARAREPLQHEELRRRDADGALGAPRGLAQRAHDVPDGVEDGARRAVGEHVGRRQAPGSVMYWVPLNGRPYK